MRTRHRIPSIFSLSMLDVFCCALGCVILLWLWNDRLAKQRAKAAGETRSLLESTRTELSAARNLLASLTAERDRGLAELADSRRDVERKAADLKTLRTRADATADQLARKTEEAEAAADLLAKKQKEQERLAAASSAMRRTVYDSSAYSSDTQSRPGRFCRHGWKIAWFPSSWPRAGSARHSGRRLRNDSELPGR